MRKKIKSTYLLLLPLLLFSCTVGNNSEINPYEISSNIEDPNLSELYILCEGLAYMNNSTLIRYSFREKKLSKNYFLTQNARGLGDTGNDMQIYGSKMYIVVNISSQVEVIDLQTGKSLKRIPFLNESGRPRQPRYIAFDKDKAYVCCFDSTVVRIDTSSLAVEAITLAGRNPDGICVSNNKLYVSNSGGLNFPDYDNTVSVIDIPTFTEIRKITVNNNPYRIAADRYGDVYVVSRGDYGVEKYCLQRISSYTDQVEQVFDEEALNFCIAGDYAYLYHFDYNNNTNWVKVLNIKTEQIERQNFITDDTDITMPYGIAANEATGDLFITEAKDRMVTGDVLCFDKEGKLKYRINDIGLNPNQVVFVEKSKN